MAAASSSPLPISPEDTLSALPRGRLDALRASEGALRARYAAFQAQGLALDLTRGKPSADQLDLSNALLDIPLGADYRDAAGTDCRNYGGAEGLPELRTFFGEILGAPAAQTLVGGQSSLSLMHDTLVRALLTALPGGETSWSAQAHRAPIRWLCPVPGYDRHFSLCAHYGIEMIPVAEGPDGPDMDQVRRLVAQDASVKGMWLVPRYANPSAVTCSDAVLDELARMPTAAPDFRIFCDDAYAEHHLVDEPRPRKSLLTACAEAGQPDRVFMFASTSKITFPGSGLSAFAASPANVAWSLKNAAVRSIGPDKINQIRHIRFLPTVEALRAHMRRHAALLRPRFEAALTALRAELAGIARWSQPQGGYFISIDTPDGCAARTVALAAQAGVRLTPAGATFPYGRDPLDRNLRLAPSFPPVQEVAQASELLAICVQLAAIERLQRAEA